MFSPSSADLLGDQVANRLVGVAVLLIEERHPRRLEPLVEATLHDHRDPILRAPLALGVDREQALLLLDEVGGNVIAADPLRVEGGDVHRDRLGQLLEVVGARHEVRLAVELEQDAEA